MRNLSEDEHLVVLLIYCRLNADGVREYFPAPLVLKGLLDLCSKLFHIQFKENKDVPVWHEDVWVYNILDKDGSYISTFYIDPYNRKGKRKTAWMEPGRLRSFIGTTPFSYMGLNVIPPSHPSEPGYMTFHDVQELFENFGNGLQQMLTTVQYSELSGQYNIEVDAVFTVAKLMRRWLSRPEVLMSISSNPITGKPMSEEMAKKIIEGESSLDAYNMCYDLCKSAFDMECHVHPWMTHWYNIFDKCWNNYMPTPLEGDDFQPNSYTFLFDEQLPAQYYSTVWGEMLAADIFEAFNEVGFEDDVKLGLVGKRFRETFLSLGGSVSGRDVFRKFRGRDPSIQPILEQFKKGQLVEQESATN
ncbi:prlC [Mytilus coruscus]|uniref:PrlC n=1 Tax=Mytilus coruscus TaxID=42192 RepID=A0A6J8D3X9_MYTCO|nr:prlC [Mytilus coruscus]